MELFIYSGYAELPSIDYDCIRTAAYVKLNEIPVKITINGNPLNSPNGFLPYLRCENDELLGGYEEIILYFQSMGYGSENTPNDYLSSSYICRLNTQLTPYRKYFLWGHPANTDAVRTLYSKRIPFPFNFSHPHKYTKETGEFLKIVANFSIDDKLEHHNTAEMIVNAKTFVNMLAERVGKKDWFFGGRKPSEFDANVYASLAILLYIQLPNNDLKSHISECPNLVKYVERIRNKYLWDVTVSGASAGEQRSAFNRIQGFFVNKEKGTISNGTIKVIAATIAIGSMAIFAISNGLLEIVREGDGDEMAAYSQYYDDEDLGEDD